MVYVDLFISEADPLPHTDMKPFRRFLPGIYLYELEFSPVSDNTSDLKWIAVHSPGSLVLLMGYLD